MLNNAYRQPKGNLAAAKADAKFLPRINMFVSVVQHTEW